MKPPNMALKKKSREHIESIYTDRPTSSRSPVASFGILGETLSGKYWPIFVVSDSYLMSEIND